MTFGRKWLVTLARLWGLSWITGKCPNVKATGPASHYCKCHRSSLLQVTPPPSPLLPLLSRLTARLIAFNWQHVVGWPLHLCFLSSSLLHIWPHSFFVLFICQRLITAFTMLTCHCTFASGLSWKSTLSLDWFDILPPIDLVIILGACHIPHTLIVDCLVLDTLSYFSSCPRVSHFHIPC